jgi:uncharacterized repeat protein (TIGR03809 family)
MTQQPSCCRLSEAARKWRNLAEQRRSYFEDLYQSGRWKRYYTKEGLLARTREVIATAERWAQLAPYPQDEPADPTQQNECGAAA